MDGVGSSSTIYCRAWSDLEKVSARPPSEIRFHHLFGGFSTCEGDFCLDWNSLLIDVNTD